MKIPPDNTKFISLIQGHQNIMHKICHVYADTAEDKRDLYQEITLQLWKSFQSFQKKSAFSTWMYRIALNTAITMTRKQRQLVDLEEQHLVLHENEAFSDKNEDIELLYRAIHRLNKIEKAIVLLWLDEKSYLEIAGITGLSVKNVSVRLVRVKKKLSKIIQLLE